MQDTHAHLTRSRNALGLTTGNIGATLDWLLDQLLFVPEGMVT